jgi:hypothetical protein
LLKKDVGRGRIVDGDKAHTFVEACCVCVFGTKAHAAKVLSGVFDEGRDQCSADSFIAPRRSDIDTPDAACVGIGIEWVDGESTYCDEKAVVEVAAENFAGRFEAICPLAHSLIRVSTKS